MRYCEQQIVPVVGYRVQPLLVDEGHIQGSLIVEDIEFRLAGRYDCLDVLEDDTGDGKVMDWHRLITSHLRLLRCLSEKPRFIAWALLPGPTATLSAATATV